MSAATGQRWERRSGNVDEAESDAGNENAVIRTPAAPAHHIPAPVVIPAHILLECVDARVGVGEHISI